MSESFDDQKTVEEKKSVTVIVKDALRELKETFIAFVKAPKALWGVNVPYVIEGLVYFGILTILGKFSSENVGLTDIQAGWVYSFVTGGITLAMVALGGYSDKIGVRMSLILSFVAILFGRALVAMSDTISLSNGFLSPMFFVMIAGLFFVVVGYGLYQPAAYAGVKRYTNPKNAAMAYGAIYGLMNLGAFLSGFISPFVRHHTETQFPPNGLAAVYWVYAILTAVALILTLILITKKADKEAHSASKNYLKKDKTTEAEGDEKPKEEGKKINNIPLYIYAAITILAFVFFALGIEDYNSGQNVFLHFLYLIVGIAGFTLGLFEFLRHRPDHPFRDMKFVFFIFILVPVQTLFAHNWLTVPYYLDRAFSGTAVSHYFEIFANINPVLIFILAPLVAGLTAKANVYRMMIYGTFVMAIPTFLLAITPNVYLFLTYVLISSIGESMWQPRFLQWIAEIAPEGKVGAYMGIGQFPWFLTKFLTGLYSGYFVSVYVPQPELGLPERSEIMWLIYGFIAILSPIGLIIAKKWMMKDFRTSAKG